MKIKKIKDHDIDVIQCFICAYINRLHVLWRSDVDDATRNDLNDEFLRQRADRPTTRIETNDIRSDLYKPIKIHIL